MFELCIVSDDLFEAPLRLHERAVVTGSYSIRQLLLLPHHRHFGIHLTEEECLRDEAMTECEGGLRSSLSEIVPDLHLLREGGYEFGLQCSPDLVRVVHRNATDAVENELAILRRVVEANTNVGARLLRFHSILNPLVLVLHHNGQIALRAPDERLLVVG